MSNPYFELTEELNAEGRIAVLASGQAVVFYRLALMSKDGDWVLRETPEACRRALAVLEKHGARYRPGAPLDVRWLRGGWSSHFELFDAERRRIRCDFFSRPPRIRADEIAALFEERDRRTAIPVVGLEPLIRMKQTQRAKDYPIVGELARLLPPDREIEWTTDPDRMVALAPAHGRASDRSVARAAAHGLSREEIVVELARETDRLQQEDRRRMERYRAASETYLRSFQEGRFGEIPLSEAHSKVCALAERLLPEDPLSAGGV